MLKWLRENWFVLILLAAAAYYRTEAFLLTSPASPEVLANGFSLFTWASIHHDAIEALAALGASVAAILLVAVTAGLWRATGKLSTSTKDLAKGAAAQAAEQRRANELAEMGNSIAANGLDEAIKEHKLNWHKWASEQRPRLRVRLVRVLPLVEGAAITIEFNIVNIGSSAATVTNTELRLQIGAAYKEGNIQPLTWTGTMSLPSAIGEGEPVRVSEKTTIIFENWSGPGMGSWRVFSNISIIGLITYTDRAGIMRRTGFYRASTEDTNRFVRVSNRDIEADYEYED